MKKIILALLLISSASFAQPFTPAAGDYEGDCTNPPSHLKIEISLEGKIVNIGGENKTSSGMGIIIFERFVIANDGSLTEPKEAITIVPQNMTGTCMDRVCTVISKANPQKNSSVEVTDVYDFSSGGLKFSEKTIANQNGQVTNQQLTCLLH